MLSLVVTVALAGCLGGVPGLDGDGGDAGQRNASVDVSVGDGSGREGEAGDDEVHGEHALADRPVEVTVEEAVRAERLVDGPRVHRPGEGRVFVAVDVEIATADDVDASVVDAALVAGNETFGRHGERLQPAQTVGPIDVGDTVEGRLLYAVPAGAEPDALRIAARPGGSDGGGPDATVGPDDGPDAAPDAAVADGAGDVRWDVPIDAIRRLDHEPGRLEIVGHDVFSRSTLSRTHAVGSVLPRVRNVGGLPVNVTGVNVVLGEERASCTADTAVPPDVTQTISAGCDWDGYVGDGRPEVDPGNYTVRLTVLANGTAVASTETTVAIP